MAGQPHSHHHAGHHHEHGHTHHDHAHHHGHGHHGHSHAPANFGAAFAVGAVLNTGFVVGEAVFGVMSHSLALLADAGHNLGDVAALLMAWAASWLAKKQPSERYTYGLRSTSMLAALVNAVVLLLITGAVAAEAVRRLVAPSSVGGLTVMAVAAV